MEDHTNSCGVQMLTVTYNNRQIIFVKAQVGLDPGACRSPAVECICRSISHPHNSNVYVIGSSMLSAHLKSINSVWRCFPDH